MKKLATGGTDDVVERQAAVESLLLNERADDALRLLEKLPFRGLTFDLLAAQSRFKEAFAAAKVIARMSELPLHRRREGALRRRPVSINQLRRVHHGSRRAVGSARD